MVTVQVPEDFTPQEADVLRRAFTNTDGSVYGFVGLPPAVAASLTAFSAHSPRSVRRLFLDVFAGDVALRDWDASSRGRVTDDAGVGTFASVHLVADQVSRPVLDLLVETPGLHLASQAASLPYDLRHHGRYRYVRPRAVLSSRFGARYIGEMDRIFDAYGQVLAAVTDHLRRSVARTPKQSDFEYRRGLRLAGQLAAGRLLPAATGSGVTIHGTASVVGRLIERMARHRLPELHVLAELLLHELRMVVPGLAIESEATAPASQQHARAQALEPAAPAANAPEAVAELVATTRTHRFAILADDATIEWLRGPGAARVRAGERTSEHGHTRPGLVVEAGVADVYDDAIDRSRRLATDLAEDFAEPSTYALSAAFRRPCSVDLDDGALGALVDRAADPGTPIEVVGLLAAMRQSVAASLPPGEPDSPARMTLRLL